MVPCEGQEQPVYQVQLLSYLGFHDTMFPYVHHDDILNRMEWKERILEIDEDLRVIFSLLLLLVVLVVLLSMHCLLLPVELLKPKATSWFYDNSPCFAWLFL